MREKGYGQETAVIFFLQQVSQISYISLFSFVLLCFVFLLFICLFVLVSFSVIFFLSSKTKFEYSRSCLGKDNMDAHTRRCFYR